MIFNTFAYFILFLVPAAILFRLVGTGAQEWVCVAFGAAFFVFFSLTQIGGVAGACCLGIFLWESAFSRLYKERSFFCLIGIAQALLFLMLFKYWNFLTGLVFPTGHNPVAWSGAFLPLGISFFTFEFIHYAVDRYRGKTTAGSFGDYMSFILFFPTMVAGPIKRYQDFRPKLVNPSLDWDLDWQMGSTRILVGLAKKFVIADLLTAFTNHLTIPDIAQAQRWVLPIWLLAYGMKIYFDFSAYSDIAIGSARLFGIRVPENFDWPYVQTNIAGFWQHWHMSLYKWLVDYVFIPLGGSRRAQPRVYLNVLITMFLSGLWHGAGLNFVVWGLWHGMLLAVHRGWKKWRERKTPNFKLQTPKKLQNPSSNLEIGARTALSAQSDALDSGAVGQSQDGEDKAVRAPSGTRIGRALSWALTFVMVNLGWAFFCMDLKTAMFFFRRLLIG